MYRVTKHYPHSLGLSACFRQWRAESHCRYLHGYALAFTIELESSYLNQNNWVVDFGAFKSIREKLFSTFDHKLIIARDDPRYADLLKLDTFYDVADVVSLPNVGCEAFAELVAGWVSDMLIENRLDHVHVVSVTCHEHAGNSATFRPI